MLNGLATLGWITFVLGLAEWLRQRETDPELVRKWVHIGIGNLIVFAWGFKFPLMLCLAFCLPFVGLTLVSYRLPILQSINGVGRRSLGTFYYALSITFLIGLFWTLEQPQYAALGVLIMTWGDALAALVGQRWGKKVYRVFGVQKTVEGSLVMAGVSTVVSVGVLGSSAGWSAMILLVAMGIGVLASGLEVFSAGGIDNLTVPIGTALTAWWLLGG